MRFALTVLVGAPLLVGGLLPLLLISLSLLVHGLRWAVTKSGELRWDDLLRGVRAQRAAVVVLAPPPP